MHLRTLRIRGFKSFPEAVEISLEPGVAVIVGPNGSGKSNIADAIVWAAGSLTPSELRAEKPDDVLFAGGADRKPAEHCEVELVFDNEDGTWPDLDFSEVSIARRLVRGAEGQYLVNRASVRRTDLVEILSDVGLGAAMHSIVGQGKVEQVLASKAEDRRAFVEEAAGLGKFKRRRHRAELKLARVAVQVERARDVEEEVRKRLRPLALQATAAERAEKLGLEIAALNARIAQLDLADSGARRAEAEERRDTAAFSRRGAQGRLEGLLGDRARAEEELSDAAGRRESAVAARYRLQGGIERLGLRGESASALLERFRAETPAAVEPEPATDIARLEHEASETAEAARNAERERVALLERTELVLERVRALDQALAEQEGLPPAARALAEDGARLALSAVDIQPGGERAVAAALRSRASAILADDAAVGLALLERSRAAGLGSLTVLIGRSPQDLVGEYPVVASGVTSRRHRAVRHGRGLRLRPGSGRAVVRGGDGRGGAARAAGAAQRAAHGGPGAREPARGRNQDRGREGATARASRRRPSGRLRAAAPRRSTRGCMRGSSSSQPNCGRASTARNGSRPASRLRCERASTPARREPGELGEELRTLGATEVSLRQELDEASSALTAAEVEIARIDAEAGDARRRLESAGEVDPAEGDDCEELAAKVTRLEARRITLGQVNPLAREEYEAEKERLSDLKTQREDLERSLEELDALCAELTATVERRFAATFEAVAEHFEEVASTLFPGGEGRLRLVEPEDEGGEPGIEVELRPAGKRITRLSLLSGGEKALGAISFLFALFLARPCAFYLLDEVEAALDDTNIARFVELLRRYADRAQFVVVTHQKRTMEAADILYGVTMGPDGVSQVVSRRLPQHQQPLAATA